MTKPRQAVCSGAAALAVVLSLGCGKSRTESETVHRLGERVPVAPLTYIVTDVKWENVWSTKEGLPLFPRDSFLVVRILVINGGERKIELPLLVLEDEKGKVFPELTEVGELGGWLGLLRSIPPGETLQGAILFDVAPAAYRLRATNGADPEHERTALIEIPYRLGGQSSALPPGIEPGP